MSTQVLNEILQEVRYDHRLLSDVKQEVETAKKRQEGISDTVAKLNRVNDAITQKMDAYDKGLADIRKENENLKAEFLKQNRPKGQSEDTESVQKRQDFEQYLRMGAHELETTQLRRLSGSRDSYGGFLVPPIWSTDVLMKSFNLASIRPVARVQTTSRDMIFPSMSKPTVGWGVIDEKVPFSTITTGQQKLQLFFLVSIAKIAEDTLNDAESDVWGILSDTFAKAIAEEEDRAFAVGEGANMPSGIFSNSKVQANYVASGVAAALSDNVAQVTNGYELLVKTMAKLKPAYLSNASWAFNSITEGKMRLFVNKDSGNYFTEIWQPPAEVGGYATLLGKRIIKPEYAPAVGAGTFPVVFGDFSNYVIADNGGISVQRMVEKYADTNEIGFKIRKRVGGMPTLADESWVAIKVAVS